MLIAVYVSPNPPNVKAAAIGTIKIAKNIITPWIKSVQQTAKNPPTKV